MLIGERPGEKEAKEGRPFIGLAGRYLGMWLKHAHLDRDDIYITNLIKEFADCDKPTQFEIQRDWPELIDELFTVQPTVIGALGTYATETLLGWERAQLERTHGIPVRATVAGCYECIVVPCFHPAAGIYNMESMVHAAGDMLAIGLTVAGDLQPPEDTLPNPKVYSIISPGEFTVRQDAGVDTESAGRRPWCLTYSCYPGISWLRYPNEGPIRFEGTVYLHNSLHDLAVLRGMGIQLADDQYRDTMVYSYLLCTEPQGLKDLAYRIAGMEMESYDEIVGGADRDRALEYLAGVDANQWEPAGEYVVVEGGKARIRKPQSINQRVRRILNDVASDKRNKDGDPVNPRKRWNQIEDYLTEEVVEALGPMPAGTLDDVPRERAVRYACRDADATLRIAPTLESRIDQMGLRSVSEIDHGIIPIVDRMQSKGIKLAPDEFWRELGDECDVQMGRAVHQIRESTQWEINPDSSQQVGELLYGVLKLPVTKYTKSGKSSTIDKALEAILSRHPVVGMVLDYREASKIKSSYVNTFRRIIRAGDGQGRVRCNMRITRVSSGRLAATNPNLLAIPVRSELGKKIRNGFVAPEGRLLLDLDFDQMEMRFMADESRDTKLVNLFLQGKSDVHRETAAGMFGVSPADIKDEQRYAAKRVGFGVITGITEHGLYDQMVLARAKRPDGEGWSKDDCLRMIQEYFQIYPGVQAFMNQAGDEAERDGLVKDRWGRVRYLPGAQSPIPAVREEARRQASSHKIQAGAQGVVKQVMRNVWQQVIRLYAGAWEEDWAIEPLLQIHDSLLFEIADDFTWIKEPILDIMSGTVVGETGIKFTAKGGTGLTWATTK